MVSVSWRKKIPYVDHGARDLLLKELFEHGTVLSDGRVSWNAIPFHEYEIALLGFLEFKGTLSPELRRRCIGDACRDCLKSGKTKSDDFEKILQACVKRYLSKRQEVGKVLTKLSCHSPSKTIKVKLFDCIITIHRDKPGRLKVTPFEDFRSIDPSIPRHYTYVTVSTAGRNIRDKFDTGLRVLTAFEGMVNLILTRGSFSLLPLSNALPLRKVASGKFFVLFDREDKRHEGTWHYVGNHDVITKDRLPSREKFSNAVDQAKVLLRRLERHPVGMDLFRALRMYQSALETHEAGAALTRMWTALEMMFFATEQSSSHEIITRAAGLFNEDRAFVAGVLSAAANGRNRVVHHGEQDDFGVALAERCKDIVERVLLFYLNNKIRLRDKEEYRTFVCAPSERVLSDHLRVLAKRDKFSRGRYRKRSVEHHSYG